MASPPTRIMLSPLAHSDAAELFLVRGDEAAMRHWDWPADKIAEETRNVVRLMLGDVEKGIARIWTIRLRENNAFVGVVDLSEMDGETADLGFMIRRDYWGRGLAFEAASYAISQAWSLGLARLNARTHADNARSRALLTRLGFVPMEEREIEIRPGVMMRCSYFALEKPRQGSSSLSQ